MVLNGHQHFVWQPALVLQKQGVLSHAQPLQPDSQSTGFMSLCRLVLYHVRVTCVQIRYQDCKTSHVFKEIPVIDASPPPYFTPKTSTWALRYAMYWATLSNWSAILLLYGPLIYSEKVCQREFFHHPSFWCWLYEVSGADKLANTLIISA